MAKPLIIKNARIIDPASNSDSQGHLLVEDGKVTDIVEGAVPGQSPDAVVINAQGKVLAPGLVDMRVFSGEPGHEYRETLASASKAAAAGGVTSFVRMPDTLPVIDDGALVEYILRHAETTAQVNVLPAAAMTRGLEGVDITEFGLLAQAGAVCLTDGRKSVQSTALLRTAFSYAANYDLPIVHHVLDTALAGKGVMNAGLFATVLGLKGIPTEAETIPLERDLQLARMTKVRYHAAQISCARSIDIMARHKAENANVSCGASINNLTLNENDIGSYRTFFKLSPPLRDEDDRQAMIEGLKAGTIDVLHSDHDPQDVEVKRHPFAEAADGAVGLETMLAAALRLYHAEQIDLLTLLRAMTSRPAEILGLDSGRLTKGAAADMILLDLDYPWFVEENKLKSRSQNTPFEGAKFSGKVTHTFVGGREIYQHVEA